MVETIVLILVVASLIAHILLLPVYRSILWYLRGMRGIAIALITSLVIADAWMLAYLGLIIINRFLAGGRLPNWILIVLGVVLLARPIVFLGWYYRWKRTRRKRA